MSKFVNYKKRGFTLPPGCKDLIELLHGPRPSGPVTVQRAEPTLTCDESGTVTVGEFSKHVTALFDSQAHSAVLTLSSPDDRLNIQVGRMAGQSPLGSVIFAEDAELERLMRELFVARGLELPSEDWTPTHFVPGIPVQFIYEISPFPITAPDTSNLISEILRRVWRLTDSSPLAFHYIEMANVE